jgi:dolichol-phosphate mannosyltransferase
LKLSVISPTFNEAENVPRLVSEISRWMEGLEYEILIVDDNSPDRTWSVAGDISRENPRVRVLRRTENPGLGLAVIDGFNAATGDIVACIDADLQHDPSILPKMVKELAGGSDIVVGSRYVYGGSGTGDWNLLRRLESRFATRLAQVFLGVQLRDPMSGYFLMRRRDFSAIQNDLNAKGFKILLEILAKLQPENLREVAYTFRARTARESKLSSKVVFRYLEQLWRLSRIGQIFSGRLLKFGFVGGSGVLVNLLVMALLLRLTSLDGWRVSALANLAANLNNYIFNNSWTFADRTHRGVQMLKGYLSYLVMSAVGLVTSTGTYVGLMWGLGRIHLSQNLNGVHSSPLALSMQLIAVLLGMFFNYELNRNVTWPNAKKVIAGSPKSDKFLVTSKLDPSPSLSPTQAAKAINFK